jgi:glyoxylase-like metal-dependent hydrolase (beta-lactamase superfamily II)
LILKHWVVGPIGSNCYLVACEDSRDALVIDPDHRTKGEIDEFLEELGRKDLKLRFIVNTHSHSDHTSGNGPLKWATGAEILVGELDAPLLPAAWKAMAEMIRRGILPPCPVCGGEEKTLDVVEDESKAVLHCEGCGVDFEILASPSADRCLHDGDEIHVGRLEFKVIHTPGHSAGGISLHLEKENVVFTGDTLFRESIGRTDLFDGSFEDIMKSIDKLMELPDDTVVYPGHGESTTIGWERRHNPFLLE